MSDIIEVKSEVIGVSTQDVSAVSEHLQTIRKFVKEQLREGKNADYWTIPGTNKDSLLKPGAEKLLKLFGLSTSIECIEKTISPEENFAMFTYKARVIHNKSGLIIAECEAMANSMEAKYMRSKSMDILNTLMKMAQKRAIVGATILATGASDYFTQDEDEIEKQKSSKTVDSSRFTNSAPQGESGSYVIPFGKHKDKTLNSMERKELESYCVWLKNNNENPDGKMKELLDKAREYLRVS